MLRHADWPVPIQSITNPFFKFPEMNQDAQLSRSRSFRSPSDKEQASVSPGSETKQVSGNSQKRASRAGTRSVNTLSVAQLERKRANDREAQRAIRARTRTHIETLERRITDLTNTHDRREKIIELTRQRNRELEEENAYLRTRVGSESFALNVSDGGRLSSIRDKFSVRD